MDIKRKIDNDTPAGGGKRYKPEVAEGSETSANSVLEKARKALALQKSLKDKLRDIKSKNVVKSSAPATIMETKDVKNRLLQIVHPEDIESQAQDDAFFDPILADKGLRGLKRRSRPTIQFVEQGSYQREAEIARLGAEYGTEYIKQLEARRNQDDVDICLSKDQKLLLDLEEKEVETPQIEWWDQKILAESSYPLNVDESHIRMDRITHYIEHPLELEPSYKLPTPPPAPLKLTRREMKKLRTQRRQAREAEKQELISQGLLEPPKPKVKISNLMRVLGSESAADPTAIEVEVSRQMAERAAAHQDRNIARMLTPAERRQKKLRKLLDNPPNGEEVPVEIKVAVYKVKDLSRPQNRFKVQMNARENHMSGMAIIVPDSFSVIVVEGGVKSQRRYEKLMLQRIQWNAEGVEGKFEGRMIEQENNYCALVWSGITAKKNFHGKFKTEIVQTENQGRKVFDDLGVAHYWDLASAYIPE